MKQTRAELTKHVGGKPTIVQRGLIDRAAWLQLHISLMDSKAMAEGNLSERDSREYLAWSNAYVRTTARLGIDAADAAPQSHADWLASISRATHRDADDDDDEDGDM
jgi:hypothetical protein